MYAFIDYTWNIFVINLLPKLANDPSSSKLERVYEQSENLERTAHLLSSHYRSWTWTQASYRQCTHVLCYQRNNVKHVDGIASLSSWTFHLKTQERWFWLRGNSPFRRQHSARRISLLASVMGSIGTIVHGNGTDASNIYIYIRPFNIWARQ